ncbi:surfactin synthase thioesterase subunit [Duganella sp. 1411]|nr:surfactin synthase thioesterase subunit [Duganella sp. 1411]
MSKPKLHFAHANSYPAGVYRQFFDRLNDRFDIQALDMHAHNPRYPVSDCWPLLVDEYIAELTARYTEPVILVGHSLGGMLSLLVAHARPDLVRSWETSQSGHAHTQALVGGHFRLTPGGHRRESRSGSGRLHDHRLGAWRSRRLTFP